jgi:hypothetical protein
MLQFAGLWLGVFSFVAPVAGGVTDQSDSPFIVDSWNNEEGLPQSSVISVIQTRDGYLWLGTLNGLVRFDGIHFTVFDGNNTPGLGSDRMVYLFEDSRTNLWVGTETAGIVMISNGTVKNFGTENGRGKIIYAAENSSGVWFHTAGGLFYYHDGKMDFNPGASSVVMQQLLLLETRTVIPSKSGGFWQLFNGTVEKIENNRPAKNFGTNQWGSATVTSACEDRDGNLIVGTLGAGIFWYDADGTCRHISKQQGLSSAFVLSLCPDRAEIFGREPTAADSTASSEKFSTRRRTRVRFAAQSISEDAIRRFVDGLQRPRSFLLEHKFRAGFRRRPVSKRLDSACGQQVSKSGPEPARKGCFNSRPIILSPRPARKSRPQIFALFEDRNGNCGPARKTASRARRAKMETVHHARRPFGKFRPRHRGRCRRKSSGSARKAAGWTFSRTENSFPIRRGKRSCPATTFPAFAPAKGRRPVGRHFRPRPRAPSKRKMDALLHGQRPRQRQHQLLIEDDGGLFVARLQHGIDADSKKIAERFCRRNGRVPSPAGLHGNRRPADARMFRRFATPPRSRERRQIMVSHDQRIGLGESGGTQTQFAAAAGHDRIREG